MGGNDESVTVVSLIVNEQGEHRTAPNVEFASPKAGEPPMHRAAREGDHNAIRALAAAGANLDEVFDMALDPNTRDRQATPLMVAAGSGEGASAATVQLLLDLGADPALIVDNATAATFAFEGLGWKYRPGGDAARAALLLAAGSPLPTDLGHINDLLCDVARAGDVERVRLLLTRGANPKGYWDPQSAREHALRMRARMDAYEATRPDIFAMLPEAMRADFAASREASRAEQFERSTSAPYSSEIPLFCAAKSGSAECVQCLLAAGADVLARDNSKRTAIFYAESAQAARVLLEAGQSLCDVDEFEWTPLRSAVTDGSTGLRRVQAFIAAGADVTAADEDGYTMFMSALGGARYLPVLQTLVAAGANPLAVTNYGSNAFHAAIDPAAGSRVEESVREVFGYLKQLGVNIEQRVNQGSTPLGTAVKRGNGLEVKVLCDLGANPNALAPKHRCGDETCDSIDLPLLFHAIDGPCIDEAAKTAALLHAGADPLATDAEGYLPMDIAIGKLCREAADPDAAWRAFYEGLYKLTPADVATAPNRDAYIAALTPMVREYVTTFARDIPIASTSRFADEWRDELIEVIISLLNFTAWAQCTRAEK